jgi:hypothetical protein
MYEALGSIPSTEKTNEEEEGEEPPAGAKGPIL